MTFQPGLSKGNDIGLLDGLMTNRSMRRYSEQPVSE